MHLKNLVLRAWWDGESTPSVEVPIGDFFGLGLGEYFTYQSALLAVAPIKALNAYFQMPFATAARITLTNEGNHPHRQPLLRRRLRHPAQPCPRARPLPRAISPGRALQRLDQRLDHNWAVPVGDAKTSTAKDNYVFLKPRAKGHFVGVTHAVEQNQDGWFGEGDDMIFIDGDKLPTINGTGTEDYYNGAWDFGGQAFDYMHNGAPYIVDPERIGGRYCLYRWHIESPITFEKSIRVTIEHGHANHRSDNFYSTAYWYQTEPHAAFPALPAADRVPRIFDVGSSSDARPRRRRYRIPSRREELRDGIQIVADGDQRRLHGTVLARLRMADIGHQRIAQALAAHRLFDLAALGHVVGHRLGGAAVADLAIRRGVGSRR
jgi:hypothetical protein